MEYLSTSLQETKKIAKHILEELLIKRRVAFYGDVGTGKTTLCRYIFSQLVMILIWLLQALHSIL